MDMNDKSKNSDASNKNVDLDKRNHLDNDELDSNDGQYEFNWNVDSDELDSDELDFD